MRSSFVGYLSFCVIGLTFQACSTIGRLPSGAELGSGVGENMGASFGRKTGNSAVCAVIGAAICGSAGSLLDRYVAELTGANRPSLYVVNGVPYTRKKALDNYKHLQKEDIRSISRMEKEEAVARYGSLGEKGAIIIALNPTTQKQLKN